MKIRILSEQMASRIAAGEVIERPASVVKELIENSLDAGATEIVVSIERSGSALIRVADNGEGMEAEDLGLAVERHATSKLAGDDDLLRIATLGFRGEALPSIGSVSRMEIVSRCADAASGHRLRVEGGKKTAITDAAAAIGTTVEIRDMFFNTPARRKFLKSPATELSHICDVVTRMALGYPNVHLRLQHDGRSLADYVAVKQAKDRLRQVLGNEIAKGMAPFSWRCGNLSAGGFLSFAPTSYPNARYLYTFVNRRYVRDKVLTHAVLQGYDTLLMKGQYPAVVLLLEIPFADVDVNVHPAKYEVRFRRQAEVHEGVATAVRQALQREAKGSSSDVQEIVPAPLIGVRDAGAHYAGHSAGLHETPAGRGQAFSAPPQAAALPIGEGFFSSMNVLGQILGCYLVCASSDGLALIDQHAAHERVAFERLRRELHNGIAQTQSLLIPQTLELGAGEIALLEKKLALLQRLGYLVESLGPESYAITAVPAFLPEGDYRPALRRMIAELAEVEDSDKVRQHLEERLATIACHSVIRANRKLEMSEMRALLRELDRTEFATQCPHGRPVLLRFSRDELDRMFKRVV